MRWGRIALCTAVDGAPYHRYTEKQSEGFTRNLRHEKALSSSEAAAFAYSEPPRRHHKIRAPYVDELEQIWLRSEKKV